MPVDPVPRALPSATLRALARHGVRRPALTRGERARRRYERAQADGIVTVGRRTYGTPEVLRWYAKDGSHVGGRVRIGAFCSIADGVLLFTGGNHRPDWLSMYPLRITYDLPGRDHDGQPHSRGDIVIGDDVWIGVGAMVLSGVTIGSGAAIGAGAVVSRDVAPYTLVAGNPAREVRRRFSEDVVEGLLSLRWWDWSDEQIAANVDLLCGPEVGLRELLERVSRS